MTPANRHPHHRHAEARDQWDTVVTHLKAALDHATDARDALLSAYSAARQGRATRHSVYVDTVIDRAGDADLHLRGAAEQLAPVRSHRPPTTGPARLTYGGPEEAA